MRHSMRKSAPSRFLSTAFAASLGLAALWPLTAAATPVSVTPTTINLRPGNASELVTLSNESDTPARFEINAFAWSESEDGRTNLTPTKDLIVFPALLELPPRGSKKIRLGAQQPASAEKSYRLVINELPQAASTDSALQLQVLTNMTLPIFLTMANAYPKIAVEEAIVEKGKLSFVVTNKGSTRFVLQRVDVHGANKSGEAFQISQKGWYVLAGGRRKFEVALGGARCRQATSITVKAFSDGPSAESSVALPPEACSDGAVIFLDTRKAVAATP